MDIYIHLFIDVFILQRVSAYYHMTDHPEGNFCKIMVLLTYQALFFA